MLINTEKPDISVLPMSALPAPGELFFDIETTGLSARTSFLYLVGFMYLKRGEVFITQAFSELPSDEINVLRYFADFISEYDTLVHFNGETFDIPYMTKKLQAAGISSTLGTMKSRDLYKEFRKFKKPLNLESLKQKAVEEYLNIPRLDRYDGNGLIDVYQHYVGLKKKEDLSLMLLHNYEDVRNMLGIRGFMEEFACLRNSSVLREIQKHDTFLSFVFDIPGSSHLDMTLRETDALSGKDIIIDCEKGVLTLDLPVFYGTLRRYFPNYKDYFYLPEEDRIVHKSIGAFVDPAFRVKATPASCFVPCCGRFVPAGSSCKLSRYQTEFKSKQIYVYENELLEKPEKASEILASLLPV